MGLRSWFQWRGQVILARWFCRIFWPPASVIVIVVEEGELLVLDTGDYFMPPGGSLKFGETFEEAAGREAREETGLEVELKEILQKTVNELGGSELVFRAERKTDSREVEGNWEGEAVWLPVEEVEDKRWRFDRDVQELVEKASKTN